MNVKCIYLKCKAYKYGDYIFRNAEKMRKRGPYRLIPFGRHPKYMQTIRLKVVLKINMVDRLITVQDYV